MFRGPKRSEGSDHTASKQGNSGASAALVEKPAFTSTTIVSLSFCLFFEFYSPLGVIKIEPPGRGDPMRDWGQGDEKVQWEVIGRNKQSVTCNLRVPEGQSLARKLATQ